MKPADRKIGVAGRKRKAARLEKDGKRNCQKADPPDDRRRQKADSVQVVLSASLGPGSANRSGRTNKGGSIGIRDPLR